KRVPPPTPLGLRVVFEGEAAELGLDRVLRDGVRNPSELASFVDAGVTFAPGEVAHQAFGFALPVAAFFPAAGERFGRPGRGAFSVERAFDQSEANLDPSDHLHRAGRTGEDPELDR